jgi:hypothetical protein
MNITTAINEADAVLPGRAAEEGDEDPRWQAIIRIGAFIPTHPEEVWAFVERWGPSEDEDLRAAIGTCLLEHLLEHHFDSIFPRVERKVLEGPLFAETFAICHKFGQSLRPTNSERWDALRARIERAS